MERYYCTDKRGQVTVKSGTTIVDTDTRVKNFFEPTPNGYIKAYDVNGLPFNKLITLPTDAELIKDARTQKTQEINTACDNEIVSGFYSSVLGEKHFYYSTIAEQSTLNSLINLGADLEFKAQKVNVDGDGVETLGARVRYLHTNAQLIGVLADGATHIGTQVAKKDELEIAIENATTVAQVDEIVW